jgi:uncharacterized protein
MTEGRFVADTNVLVSQLLSFRSAPARAFRKARAARSLILSQETTAELSAVLAREKFDPYVSRAARLAYVEGLRELADHVEPEIQVAASRDPADDKFLALALDGGADLLLSGDGDLLALHPFRGVRILAPAAYLAAPWA